MSDLKSLGCVSGLFQGGVQFISQPFAVIRGGARFHRFNPLNPLLPTICGGGHWGGVTGPLQHPLTGGGLRGGGACILLHPTAT